MEENVEIGFNVGTEDDYLRPGVGTKRFKIGRLQWESKLVRCDCVKALWLIPETHPLLFNGCGLNVETPFSEAVRYFAENCVAPSARLVEACIDAVLVIDSLPDRIRTAEEKVQLAVGHIGGRIPENLRIAAASVISLVAFGGSILAAWLSADPRMLTPAIVTVAVSGLPNLIEKNRKAISKLFWEALSLLGQAVSRVATMALQKLRRDHASAVLGSIAMMTTCEYHGGAFRTDAMRMYDRLYALEYYMASGRPAATHSF